MPNIGFDTARRRALVATASLLLFGAISDIALLAQAAAPAPEALRMSTVRNLDVWYDAFGVVPGERLYLEPSARVRVW
jgi:hypothetical protein